MDELKQELMIHHEKGHRCSICNCVNIEDIETDLGDYHYHMSFTTDPKSDNHFICITCYEIITETLDEFGEDEENDERP